MKVILEVPCEATVRVLIASLERNLLPDVVIRTLIRLFIETRLRHTSKLSVQISHLLQCVRCMYLCKHVNLCVRISKYTRFLCIVFTVYVYITDMHIWFSRI